MSMSDVNYHVALQVLLVGIALAPLLGMFIAELTSKQCKLKSIKKTEVKK